MTLEPPELVRLAEQGGPGVCLSAVSALELQTFVTASNQPFTWVLGIQIQILLFVQQTDITD